MTLFDRITEASGWRCRRIFMVNAFNLYSNFN
jgi:hypothetical protein